MLGLFKSIVYLIGNKEGYFSNYKLLMQAYSKNPSLTPFLFLVMTILNTQLARAIKLFADDTYLYVITDENPVETSDLDRINKWAKKWDLMF